MSGKTVINCFNYCSLGILIIKIIIGPVVNYCLKLASPEVGHEMKLSGGALVKYAGAWRQSAQERLWSTGNNCSIRGGGPSWREVIV